MRAPRLVGSLLPLAQAIEGLAGEGGRVSFGYTPHFAFAWR